MPSRFGLGFLKEKDLLRRKERGFYWPRQKQIAFLHNCNFFTILHFKAIVARTRKDDEHTDSDIAGNFRADFKHFALVE